MTTRFFTVGQSVKDVRRGDVRYVEGGDRVRSALQSSTSDIEMYFEVEGDYEEFLFFLRALNGIQLTQDTIRLLHAVAKQRIPHETVCAMLSISLLSDGIEEMGSKR